MCKRRGRRSRGRPTAALNFPATASPCPMGHGARSAAATCPRLARCATRTRAKACSRVRHGRRRGRRCAARWACRHRPTRNSAACRRASTLPGARRPSASLTTRRRCTGVAGRGAARAGAGAGLRVHQEGHILAHRAPGERRCSTRAGGFLRSAWSSPAGSRRRLGAVWTATPAASSRRSRPTAASSPSSPSPPTWCRATPTGSRTSSSATGGPGAPSGSASAGQRASQRGQRQHSASRARRSRADGRFVAFTSARHQPGARRHQRRARTSSSATAARARPSGSASARSGAQANGASGYPGALGGRPLRRLRSRSPATWCRATPTGTTTSSSATGRPARPSG